MRHKQVSADNLSEEERNTNMKLNLASAAARLHTLRRKRDSVHLQQAEQHLEAALKCIGRHEKK